MGIEPARGSSLLSERERLLSTMSILDIGNYDHLKPGGADSNVTACFSLNVSIGLLKLRSAFARGVRGVQ